MVTPFSFSLFSALANWHYFDWKLLSSAQWNWFVHELCLLYLFILSFRITCFIVGFSYIFNILGLHSSFLIWIMAWSNCFCSVSFYVSKLKSHLLIWCCAIPNKYRVRLWFVSSWWTIFKYWYVMLFWTSYIPSSCTLSLSTLRFKSMYSYIYASL